MEAPQPITEQKKPSKHRVWDKSIPKLMWNLVIDPRMPKEWNQVMVDFIRQTEYIWPVLGEWYRGMTSDEVSEPDEFQWNSGVQEEPITQLMIPDKSDICLAAMRKKYE